MNIKKPVQKSSANDIKTLEGAEAIRKRPGMYIGALGSAGVFRLFNEAVGNVLDLYNEDAADIMVIRIDETKSIISVTDNGYGMPIEKIDDILTKSHTSGKFENNGFSIGMNGIGAKAVNALSSRCEVEVKRDGKLWQFKSSKGVITQSTKSIKELDNKKETGTTIKFIPDKEILGDFEIESEKYLEFLTQLSYMSKGLTIDFQSKQKDGKVLKKVLKSENGHLDYIRDIEKNPLIKEPIYIEDKTDNKQLFMCINYSTKRDEDLILSFVNSMATTEHGTHVQGAKMALTNVFKKYIDDNKLLQKKDANLDINGDDVIESISIILELKWIEPLFDSQTKDRLTSSEAIGYVRKVVTDQLTYYLNKNKNEAKLLCNKIISNARGRRASKNAKLLTKKKDNNPFTSISNMSKYTKASSKDPEKLELFIVEGNSAGGSAAQGRNTDNQAIYRLRGKPLNTTTLDAVRVIKNKEFSDIVTILGTGLDNHFDSDKLTHNTIVIMADADIDGSHISALMIAFFYKHMPQLIENGHIYCAVPPLYKIRENGKDIYIKDREEYNNYVINRIINAYTIGTVINNKAKSLTNEIVVDLIKSTTKYTSILENISNKLAANPELIELIAVNRDIELKDLLTLITAKYPYLEGKMKKNGLFIDGLIDSDYQSILVNDQLLLDIKSVIDILDSLPVEIFVIKGPNDRKARRISLYSLIKEIMEYGTPGKLVRFKGLGEMNPGELYETAMDPNKRNLIQVTIDDAKEAERQVNELMGY